MTSNNSYMVIIKSDKKDFMNIATEEEIKIMGDHFEYLKQLLSEGKLILAGPTLDDTGGYLILNVIELTEAKAIMSKDPSVESGIMTPEFHSFKTSLCKCQK